MSTWQLIFVQSRANNGAYDGDQLPAQLWDWPKGTWLQERLSFVRKTQRRVLPGLSRTGLESLPWERIHLN